MTKRQVSAQNNRIWPDFCICLQCNYLKVGIVERQKKVFIQSLYWRMKRLLTEWVRTDCLLVDALMSRRLSQRSSDVDSCCICRVVAANCSLTQLMYGSALKEPTCRSFTSQHHSCWIYRPPSCSSEALCCKIKQISTDSQGNHWKTLTLRNLIIYTSTPQQSVRPGQALELMRWEWEAFEKCLLDRQDYFRKLTVWLSPSALC